MTSGKSIPYLAKISKCAPLLALNLTRLLTLSPDRWGTRSNHLRFIAFIAQ